MTEQGIRRDINKDKNYKGQVVEWWWGGRDRLRPERTKHVEDDHHENMFGSTITRNKEGFTSYPLFYLIPVISSIGNKTLSLDSSVKIDYIESSN